MPFTVDHPIEANAHLCSMRLINVKTFLERESLIREGKRVDRRAKVLDFGDDEATEYVILSHRWVGQEVDYDEMIELAKMAVEERDEIRQRDGYRKILQSCERAQKDGYEWLWVDTCCIDKRSSAELSEAINSMYRWYENAVVCYAYLHDVPDPCFPTANDKERYPDFNGWPEWFSRGWTLQELIAPGNVQFLNRNWQGIGDKTMLAPTLRNITGVPEHVLIHGLCGNRPCVAQIMSWAARRTTTRVEDRAYSLMGLLDVNMPMLYGEGKKAFHRLQLEIIRASNDHSIFAWTYNVRTGSILADNPSFFRFCGRMELMGHDEFIQFVKKDEDAPEEELDSVEDRLGTFPITNRGIQIWLLLRPCRGFPSLFQAWLPCRDGPMASPVTIDLALWESNYYRGPVSYFGQFPPEGPLRLRQVNLRYQDPPHRNTTFQIDDSALIENGFTCCDTYPMKFARDGTLTLTSTNSLCIKIYSNSLTNHRFVVGLGLSFGKDWIHVVSDGSNTIPRSSWRDYVEQKYIEMKARTPEHAQHMNKARSSGAEHHGQVCIMQTRLPRTTRILQISSVMWRSSRMYGVKLEVFRDPGFGNVSGEWTAFDVDVGSFFALIGTSITIYLRREQTIPAVTGGVS
ncbi:hypothetical protein SCLCIDRAFT_586486 [Scleroderma citrinum Foug A]|uniref:Heterokaryon incompatibility domain-containing protein n=1 Tax=Scleroderma citrinum Foug A TaxID=1036808 RepID=A0A0C3E9N4_9AGAM|nr:hypothetical protein SCLCIDRAFT_586486 [Scleroderma citrinum Foug A]